MKKLMLTLSVLLMTVAQLAIAQDVNVSGTVVDANGPVAGAFVVVKGTTNGTISDNDGTYTIKAPTTGTLVFSCLGYTTAEVLINGNSTVNVTLQEDSQVLADAVVLGYGVATKKKDLSAAVGVVADPEALASRPVSSVESMLQGQVAGVSISSNGGDPTASPNIVIRGQGSQNGDQVLWVVDGIPGAPIASLNDIESIVVLKDAASAAIYGAQSGAGGVVLVTTKKSGQKGISVNYDGVYGVRTATNLIQSLNAEEEIEMRKTSYANAGLTLPDAWNPSKNSWIKTTRTNWINEVFRTAAYHRNSVAVNYNSDKLQTRLSFSNDNNEGVLVGTHNNKMGIHFTGAYQINKWIKVTEDLTWEQKDLRTANTNSPQNGALINAIVMPQSALAYNPDGTYSGTVPDDQAQWASAHGDSINPLRILLAHNDYDRRNSLWTTTGLEVGNFCPGLKFNSRFTYAMDSQFSKVFTPRRPEIGKPEGRNFLDYTTGRNDRWKLENTLTYDKTFNKHSVGLLLSNTLDHYNGRYIYVNATDLADESAFLQYLNNAQNIKTSDEFRGNDANVAIIARAAYSYDDRYFVTASWRRDYAGRLAKGHNYGDFPAVTAAWKISSEKFMPKTDALTLLKLRASFGRVGNLGSIAMNYRSAQLSSTNWQEQAQYGVEKGTTWDAMYYNSKAINPNLTWETSEQFDLGLDAAFFKDRLSFSMDFYNKRTFNLIQNQTMNWPQTIGLDPMLVNMGEVMNRGIELTVGWQDKIGDWSYNIGANMAYNKNWVSDIGVRDSEGKAGVWLNDQTFKNVPFIYQTAEGQPIGSFYVIKTDGIFQSDAEAAAYVDKDGNRIQPKAKAGDLKFVDFNGDGKIDNNDRQYIGSATPKLNYAFNGGFTWKDLSFSFMFQGVAGAKAAYMAKYTLLNEADGADFNRSRDILNAWSPTNTNTNIPRITRSDDNENFTTPSDWYIEDASYLRLKNITLSYDLTNVLRKAAHFNERASRLSVYFSGENLFTITKYSGMDPECGGYDAVKYPVSRVLSFGVKLTY